MTMENPCVNSVATYFNMQNVYFSVLPQDFSRPFRFFLCMTFSFQPFYHFAVSFWDNSNLISGFPLMVSCFSCIVEDFIGRRRKSKREHAYVKQFGVAWSAMHSTDHCYHWLPELPECRLYYTHEIVRWPCGKVIFHS